MVIFIRRYNANFSDYLTKNITVSLMPPISPWLVCNPNGWPLIKLTSRFYWTSHPKLAFLSMNTFTFYTKKLYVRNNESVLYYNTYCLQEILIFNNHRLDIWSKNLRDVRLHWPSHVALVSKRYYRAEVNIIINLWLVAKWKKNIVVNFFTFIRK